MKPTTLKWSEEYPPQKDGIPYDHVTSKTPFGDISIEWKSWKQYDSFVVNFPWGDVSNGDDLNEAKELAQMGWNERVMTCIEA